MNGVQKDMGIGVISLPWVEQEAERASGPPHSDSWENQSHSEQKGHKATWHIQEF